MVGGYGTVFEITFIPQLVWNNTTSTYDITYPLPIFVIF
jgi:hypothetical protein